MDSAADPFDLSAAVEVERTRLRIASRPEWIAPTIDYLKRKAQQCGACQESRAGKLTLALHEALTNAVVHGNLEVSSALKEEGDDAFARALSERAANPEYARREVVIDIAADADACRWSITDQGPGFDFQRYLEREPDPETMFLSSGRGILLMRSFVDEVRYEQGGRRVTLTLQRTSGHEKRGQPREPLYQRVQVAPIRSDGSVDWDAAQDALGQNLSSSGIGLLQAQLTTTGRVLIGVEAGGRTYYMPAQVSRCQPVGEGMVELGCRFLLHHEQKPALANGRPAVESAVGALLLQRRTPLSEDDRRTHPREAYTERIEVLGDSPVHGFSRDLSLGGIAFITTVPLPLKPCVLALPQHGGPPLRLLARVIRCAELAEGFYDVGACFLGLSGS